MEKMFYDEDGKKLLIYLERGIIGSGIYGVVYKVNEEKCLKYVTNDTYTHLEVIKEIMNMDLKSFYKIYKLLYDRHKQFTGYLMKYYEAEDIDILTMPTEYTLDNLSKIISDSKMLTDKKIVMGDSHSENIILDSNNMTIIDVDNYYYFNVNDEKVAFQNNKWINKIFFELYTEALEKKHMPTIDEYLVLNRLFKGETINAYNELKGYKYPIDYIKKRSLEPIKYVMKKGM